MSRSPVPPALRQVSRQICCAGGLQCLAVAGSVAHRIMELCPSSDPILPAKLTAARLGLPAPAKRRWCSLARQAAAHNWWRL